LILQPISTADKHNHKCKHNKNKKQQTMDSLIRKYGIPSIVCKKIEIKDSSLIAYNPRLGRMRTKPPCHIIYIHNPFFHFMAVVATERTIGRIESYYNGKGDAAIPDNLPAKKKLFLEKMILLKWHIVIFKGTSIHIAQIDRDGRVVRLQEVSDVDDIIIYFERDYAKNIAVGKGGKE